ncbi:MAG: protein translocase subunit SecD [Pirellulales bacterium]
MVAQSLYKWLVTQAQPAIDAAAPAAADAAEAAADSSTVLLQLLAAVGIIGGSFAAGVLLARALRLPDFGVKIGVIIFALVASLAVNYAGWPPKRGIDLSGGVVLVYEVDRESTKPSWMPAAIAQLNSSLNKGGGERVNARAIGSRKIEIVAPPDFDPGTIERAVLALRDTMDVTLHDSGEPRTEEGKTVFGFAVDDQQSGFKMDELIAAVSRRINPGGVKELTIRQYGAEQLEVIIPEVDEQEVEQIKKRISKSGMLEFRIVANQTDDADILRAGAKSVGPDVYIGGKLVGRWVRVGKDFRLSPEAQGMMRPVEGGGEEVLVRIDPYNVEGAQLERAAQGFDQGRLVVEFSFDTQGASRFRQLTSHNLPDPATGFYRHLGIVLDNEMLSAPRINDIISGQGQIEGQFTSEEVKFLVDVLNAGKLPATLFPEPISQQRISAQLGDDTIRQGSRAMIISTGAVLVFMAIYYRFAGLVACFGVVLNMVITVALMIMIKAAFTLPGLAGLALTVGMAVDANVLIYERMREETARGASLRMAIRNGFARATSTIIDSNMTTVITGIVLYVIGTDQIKGFAVTLILGLCVSMFTAIFVSRVVFDVFERKRWLTQLKMMQLVGETHIDFIRWRTPAIVISSLVIVVGLAAAASRGKGLLDIDFTGGSSVHVLFAPDKGRDIADVRNAVAELPDVAVSSVGENNREFKVDTSEGDIKVVQKLLRDKFEGSLQTYSMKSGELATIAEVRPADAAAETKAGETAPAAAPAETAPAETAPASPPAEDAPPAEPAAETPAPPAETPAPPAETPAPPATEPATPPQSPQSSLPSRARASFQLTSFAVHQAATSLAVAQEPAAADTETPAAEIKSEPAEAPTEAAQPAEATTDAQPATDKPVAETPAESPAADTPAATAEPASTETPAAAQPDATQPAAAQAETAPAAGEESAAEATLGTSLVGGTRVPLTFPDLISHDPLSDLIKQQLADMKLSGTPFLLRNAKYGPGSDAPLPDWTLEIALDQAQTRTLLDSIAKQLQDTPVFPSSNQIGGKVAGDTQLMALYAMLASLVMIVLYVWIRFQNVIFGLAAVLALLHDVLMAVAFLGMSYYLSPYLGFLQVDPFKISLAVVAALLTIVGFSINDTIVIFDRIREVRGKSPELTADMINLSVNQTLSRTILTSGTVLVATVILYFMGGPGIHAFAYTMVIGVIAGTYSTVYIAAPVLLWLRRPATTPQKTVRAPAALGSEARRAGA